MKRFHEDEQVLLKKPSSSKNTMFATIAPTPSLSGPDIGKIDRLIALS